MDGPTEGRTLAHQRFVAARQVLLQAYLAWLQSDPLPSWVVCETEATVSALEQLHELMAEDR